MQLFIHCANKSLIFIVLLPSLSNTDSQECSALHLHYGGEKGGMIYPHCYLNIAIYPNRDQHLHALLLFLAESLGNAIEDDCMVHSCPQETAQLCGNSLKNLVSSMSLQIL